MTERPGPLVYYEAPTMSQILSYILGVPINQVYTDCAYRKHANKLNT